MSLFVLHKGGEEERRRGGLMKGDGAAPEQLPGIPFFSVRDPFGICYLLLRREGLVLVLGTTSSGTRDPARRSTNILLRSMRGPVASQKGAA